MGFLIQGGPSCGCGQFCNRPSRQARPGLSTVVDPGFDRRVDVMRTTRNQVSLSSWAQPHPATESATWLRSAPCISRRMTTRDISRLMATRCARARTAKAEAEHVHSAYCGGLQTMRPQESSRGKGLKSPDTLKLLERFDWKSKIVAGDEICCQKSITTKIVEDGGDYTRGRADHALKRLRCPQRTPLPRCSTERQNRRTPEAAQGHGRTLLRKSAAPV
jgi:hypothetical protein